MRGILAAAHEPRIDTCQKHGNADSQPVPAGGPDVPFVAAAVHRPGEHLGGQGLHRPVPEPDGQAIRLGDLGLCPGLRPVPDARGTLGRPLRAAPGPDLGREFLVPLHRPDGDSAESALHARRAIPLRGGRGGGVPHHGPRVLLVDPDERTRPRAGHQLRGLAPGGGLRHAFGRVDDYRPRLARHVRLLGRGGLRVGDGLVPVVPQRPGGASPHQPGGAGPHPGTTRAASRSSRPP
jgi:hypothetical protein